MRPVLHQDFYTQFDKRFSVYRKIDRDGHRDLVLPVLKCVTDAGDGSQLDAPALPDRYSRIHLAESLEMLVEHGFIHFTEDADGNRTWLPASRLAKLWWRRSRLA